MDLSIVLEPQFWVLLAVKALAVVVVALGYASCGRKKRSE